ncbi:hypothetical protein JZ751_023494, partial [Albula glossodonta]
AAGLNPGLVGAGRSKSGGSLGPADSVIGHSQAYVVVVSGRFRVVGPADGQDVVRSGRVHGEVVQADDPPVSVTTGQTQHGFCENSSERIPTDLQLIKERKEGREEGERDGGRREEYQSPAVGSEVIVSDAGTPWRLLVRDVGRHQGAMAESHMPDWMPADRSTNQNHLAPILISQTHTRPSPPPLTIFQSSAWTAVTPRWWAYSEATGEPPPRRSKTRTLKQKRRSSQHKPTPPHGRPLSAKPERRAPISPRHCWLETAIGQPDGPGRAKLAPTAARANNLIREMDQDADSDPQLNLRGELQAGC